MLNSKPILILLLLLFACSMLHFGCKSDDDVTPAPEPELPVDLEKVSDIEVLDIGEAGNGNDLQISFTKIADESKVEEYRIFVVKSSESADFNLEKSKTIFDENLSIVAKTGSDISITLSANSKTTSGELISNDIPYNIFVSSLSNDLLLYNDVLSASSPAITLTTEIIVDEKVKVTYIANDGVMIEFEDKKVVIDAINVSSNLGGWISPSTADLQAVVNGDPPFDDIDVIMITHNHGDHYATSAVQNYLSNHPDTKLIVPDTMKPNFAAYADRIPDYTLNKFERENLIVNGISIDILEIEHFDQFGNDFSGDEAFAYVVHLDDKQFLHTGDIDYIDSQLGVFNLLNDDVTVAFIPTFGNLVSAANRDALIDNVNPDNIICLHFLTSTLSTTLNQVNNIYPDAEVFTTPFQTLEY